MTATGAPPDAGKGGDTTTLSPAGKGRGTAPLTSAPVLSKAVRYLAAGRVLLLEVAPARVAATVRGTADDPYLVVWTRLAGWTCTCPAYGACAHVLAVQAVTTGRDLTELDDLEDDHAA